MMKRLFLGWSVMAVFFFVLSFLVPDAGIDIHMHDTYFVVTNQLLLMLMSACCLLIALIYLVLRNRFKNNYVSVIHILLFLGGILLCAISLQKSKLNPDSLRYIDVSENRWLLLLLRENPYLFIGSLLILVSFILFFMRVVFIFLRKEP